MPKLKNRKRERFAIEIAAMTPLEQAYVDAGYQRSPWARYNASKLAHHPEVAARIEELCAEFSARSQINAEYIQHQLLPLIEANARDLFEPGINAANGNRTERLRSITELPRRLAAAIHRVKLNADGSVAEILMHDKNSAGATLLRSVGGMVDRLKVSDDTCAYKTTEQMWDDLMKEFRRFGVVPSPLLDQVEAALAASLLKPESSTTDGTEYPARARKITNSTD